MFHIEKKRKVTRRCDIPYSRCSFVVCDQLGAKICLVKEVKTRVSKLQAGSGLESPTTRPDKTHTSLHGWLISPKGCWNFGSGFFVFFLGRWVFWYFWVFCYFWVMFYKVGIDTKSVSNLKTWPNHLYDTGSFRVNVCKKFHIVLTYHKCSWIIQFSVHIVWIVSYYKIVCIIRYIDKCFKNEIFLLKFVL